MGREIIKVNYCDNISCTWNRNGECWTDPEVELLTMECMSNTDDWGHHITQDMIARPFNKTSLDDIANE